MQTVYKADKQAVVTRTRTIYEVLNANGEWETVKSYDLIKDSQLLEIEI